MRRMQAARNEMMTTLNAGQYGEWICKGEQRANPKQSMFLVMQLEPKVTTSCLAIGGIKEPGVSFRGWSYHTKLASYKLVYGAGYRDTYSTKKPRYVFVFHAAVLVTLKPKKVK